MRKENEIREQMLAQQNEAAATKEKLELEIRELKHTQSIASIEKDNTLSSLQSSLNSEIERTKQLVAAETALKLELEKAQNEVSTLTKTLSETRSQLQVCLLTFFYCLNEIAIH